MQGESLWLHLPIIKELAAMCHEVFVGGSVSYAYTTIPTYPRCTTAYHHPVMLPSEAAFFTGCGALLCRNTLAMFCDELAV